MVLTLQSLLCSLVGIGVDALEASAQRLLEENSAWVLPPDNSGGDNGELEP
jgi:hypothetical protein